MDHHDDGWAEDFSAEHLDASGGDSADLGGFGGLEPHDADPFAAEDGGGHLGGGHFGGDEPGYPGHGDPAAPDLAGDSAPGDHEDLLGGSGHDGGTGAAESGLAPVDGHDGTSGSTVDGSGAGPGHDGGTGAAESGLAPVDGHDGTDAAGGGHPADPGDVPPGDTHPGDGHPDGSHPDDSHPGDGNLPEDHVGADPDLPAEHDGVWHDGDFPPELDLGHAVPEPADGWPWSDPATLGGTGDAGDLLHEFSTGSPPAADLYAYAGLDLPGAGTDPWTMLLGGPDPAAGALARWWGPALA